MARLGIYQKLERFLIKSFCYICKGLVLVHRHFMKPRNVVCNIFSELTPKAFLLFFSKEIYWNCYRKILCDNRNPNRTLSIIFVLKLRFRKKYVVKLKPETKLCVKICFVWQSKLYRKTLRWVFLSSENIMQHTTAV